MKRIASIACASLMLLLHIGPAAAADGSGSLKIDITDVRNRNGTVNFAVFASSEGFPGKPEKAVRRMAGKISETGEFRMELDLPEGKYAVAVYHDENGDGKLNKNFLGIPTEGVGFSKNPTVRLAPPKFDDCVVSTGNDLVTIKVHY